MTTPLAFHEQGDGWHLRPRRGRMFRLVGVLIGALALLGSATLLAEGRPLAAVLVGVLGLTLASFPFARSGRSAEPRLHGGGLLLPARPMTRRLVVGLAVIGLACAAGVVVLLVDVFRTGDLVGLVGVVVLAAVAALFGTGVVAGVRSRRARDRGVLLSADGVRLSNRLQPVHVPWADVARVHPHWTRLVRGGLTSPGETIHNWLTLELRHEPTEPSPLSVLAGTPHPTVGVADLAVDPHQALATARFYLAHPEARGELGSEAALRRTAGLGGPRHAPEGSGPDRPSGV